MALHGVSLRKTFIFLSIVSVLGLATAGCEQQYGITTYSVDGAHNVEIGGPADPLPSGPGLPATPASPSDPVAPTLPGELPPAPISPSQPGAPLSPSPGESSPETPSLENPSDDGDKTNPGDSGEDSPKETGGTKTPVSDPTGGDPVSPTPAPAPTSSPTSSPDPSAIPKEKGDDPGKSASPVITRSGRKVIVNIASVLITMQEANGGRIKNALVARNLGKMDLLALSPGVLGTAKLSPGSVLHEVELRLFPDGHEVIEDGVVVCDLKVPSSKFQMKFHAVEVKTDAKHSIQLPESEVRVHFLGGGDCNLRPVGWPHLLETGM